MASPAQIQANRSNSAKIVGPTSSTGKAVSRFNALKTGIYAKELILPGEDPAELEALAADYWQQIGPLSRIEHFLVDSLLENDWRMRRLRKAETQLWAANPDPSVALGENTALTRLYRLIAAHPPRLFAIAEGIDAATRRYRTRVLRTRTCRTRSRPNTGPAGGDSRSRRKFGFVSSAAKIRCYRPPQPPFPCPNRAGKQLLTPTPTIVRSPKSTSLCASEAKIQAERP